MYYKLINYLKVTSKVTGPLKAKELQIVAIDQTSSPTSLPIFSQADLPFSRKTLCLRKESSAAGKDTHNAPISIQPSSLSFC